MSESTVIKMLPVSSVPQSTVAKGFTQITQSTRTSEKQPTIPEGMRSRSIIIPEFSVPEVPSKFTQLVIGKLQEAAQAQLAGLWKAEPHLKEVPENLWSVDAVLMFIAREEESKRLSKESVEAWFLTTDLYKRITAKLGESPTEDESKANKKLLAEWLEKLQSLSAPQPKTSLSDCELILKALTRAESDAESLIGAQLVRKIDNRVKELRKQMEEVSKLEEI